MRHVPQRYLTCCHFCGDTLDTRQSGTYSLQIGWMKNRSQGGGNALALREASTPLQWACGFCIEKRQHNRVGQGQLFG